MSKFNEIIEAIKERARQDLEHSTEYKATGAIHPTGDPKMPYSRDIRKLPKRPRLSGAQLEDLDIGIDRSNTMVAASDAIPLYMAGDDGEDFPEENIVAEMRKTLVESDRDLPYPKTLEEMDEHMRTSGPGA